MERNQMQQDRRTGGRAACYVRRFVVGFLMFGAMPIAIHFVEQNLPVIAWLSVAAVVFTFPFVWSMVTEDGKLYWDI